jgi:hypothetical protein
MSNLSAARVKEITEIRNGLQSSEDDLIKKALSKIATKGDSSLISDLITLWAETDSQLHKNSVESVLFGLKEKKALETLINYLDTDVSEESKWLALNAIWQSGFDASEHLSALIDFAINNSYTNAIDVMTIIENSEFDVEQEDLVDSNLLKLNDYLLKNKSDNLTLLLEIKSILIEKKIEG